MTTTARLDNERVDVDPGGVALIPLQIRNTGDLVEGYDLQVVGPLSEYASVEPPQVRVYPGDETMAMVSFRPPRSPALRAGEVPFGVNVLPSEHPDDAVVLEGMVHLLPFLDTTVELVPRSSRSPFRGRHQVAVDNRGSVRVTAAIAAVDQAETLTVKVPEEPLAVEPEQAGFAPIRVRPARLVWTGPPTTHPFQVVVTPEGDTPVTLDGTYLQEPLLPPWLGKVLLALLAALLALAGLVWLAREQVRQAALEAVAPQVARAEEQAAQAEEAAQTAEQAAAQAAGTDPGGMANGGGNAVTSDQQVTVPTGTVLVPADATLQPFSERLQRDTAAGQTGAVPLPVPAEETWQLTDLVLQNPQGDFGRVSMLLDDEVLFSLALENFRDLDYHFVSPIVATSGQEVRMVVECEQVGTPPGQTSPPAACDTAAYLGGQVVRPASG